MVEDLHTVWTGAPELDGLLDPFRFDHRMAAYRTMIDRTNRDGLFGADNRRNPLWGLMFQHQWQFRTGRLGATAQQDGRIDPDAPWGYGNYVLSVVPWLGAAEAGTVPELEPAGPPGPTRFRYAHSAREVPPELAAGVADWRTYFALVARTPPGGDDEPLRSALWKAHKTCLDVVARDVATLSGTAYPDHSDTEITFLRGWCRMVDFLWAAAWRTDFDSMTGDGLDVLPERLLGPGDDEPGGARDLPRSIRRNVRTVIGLARTPDRRYALDLWLWTRVMRTRAARDRVLPLLDGVFHPRPDNRSERLRALGYLLRP
ncbi:Leg1-related protein [Pseudonocardia endophytica]|uniref:Uncharacterized protein DUF781 n=1 Tax=Pseudonocardia endophytica TaxID=401976 RepID=A0A4R1HUF3_PSEEN|nr:Leg1-related protein [Pseudonocardia endophytica]TCK24993.1 uncharacterized protein DUF781 [Pseudonocardia endophytica]